MNREHLDRPRTLAGYLEAMAKVVFAVGMNWRAVEPKWSGISEALLGFDVEKVAALTPDDVDRLVSDVRLIRNRRKIEAIVENAGILLELDKNEGGFAGYLGSRGGFEAQITELKRDFKFLGPTSAPIFLYMVGEQVPQSEDCSHISHGGC